MRSWAQLVYSKRSPGARRGCLPTTPSPFTSSTFPVASVMIQWRLRSWAGSPPSLRISTVYMKAYWWDSGLLRSGQNVGFTVTRMPSVVAEDMPHNWLARRPDASQTYQPGRRSVPELLIPPERGGLVTSVGTPGSSAALGQMSEAMMEASSTPPMTASDTPMGTWMPK